MRQLISKGAPLLCALALATSPIYLSPVHAQLADPTCNQLRSTVAIRVPIRARDLPYDALDCGAISEIFLLTNRFDGNASELSRRIEAVFRRFGLVT